MKIYDPMFLQKKKLHSMSEHLLSRNSHLRTDSRHDTVSNVFFRILDVSNRL